MIGFLGFISIRALKKCNDIPNQPGTYVVIRPDFSGPKFIDLGSALIRKGKNPNVTILELLKRWIQNTQLVYVESDNKSIKSNISQLLEFGSGNSLLHWNGRFLWQITNIDEYYIAWKVQDKAEQTEDEDELCKEFMELYGKLPFAN